MKRNRGAAKGQFIVGGVVFLAMLMVVVQAMVYWTQTEAKWTKKESRTTTAFYLAEAGYNRAIWMLKDRPENFEDLSNGATMAGYNNDVTYSDVTGGQYRIRITSGPLDQQLTVVSTGKDTTSNEFRRIEAVLDRHQITSPLIAPSVALTGGAVVHWGSMLSTGNINLQAGANQLYPRKLARGSITASGGSYGNRDSDPTPQNTDTKEWWSYNEAPGVPDPVQLDLAYYKGLAQAQGRYYTAANAVDANVVDLSTSSVRYYEHNVKFTGNYHFRGVVIVLGNLDFAGSAKSPEGNITVTPPTQAYLEYQKNTPSAGTSCGGGGGAGATDDGNYSNNANAEGDKACVDQYPGDAGLNVVENYVIGTGCVSHSHLGGATNAPAAVSGLVYVRGQFKATGATVIHGSVIIEEGGSWGGGSVEIFYDPSLMAITSDTVQFSVNSWRETIPQVF